MEESENRRRALLPAADPPDSVGGAAGLADVFTLHGQRSASSDFADELAFYLDTLAEYQWARDAAGLMPSTIEQLVKPVIELCDHYDTVPWRLEPAHLDRYFAGPGKRARETVRSKINKIDGYFAAQSRLVRSAVNDPWTSRQKWIMPFGEASSLAGAVACCAAGSSPTRVPWICFSSYWRSKSGAMENDGPLLTIGELAKRVGVPVRTIRFWSDSGLVPPASRTDGDRRLYDAACVARLELVTTLRELGVGLANVRRVLDGQVTAAEVAAVHLEALDTEIRVMRLRRAVVAAVVKRSADGTEMSMINKLARLSAAERRQIIDDFTAEAFAGLNPSPARFARWSAAPDLPDDPSAEQVEAWVDLAELVADRGFREQVRRVVADVGIQVQSGTWLADVDRAQDEAEAARQRGVPPGSAEAAQIVERILAGTPGAHRRSELLAQLEAGTDPRIERYWELTAIISGRGPFPSLQPALEWLAAALRASQDRKKAAQ